MIKFEKDNYIMYFEDADQAAEWVIDQYENGGEFEGILEDIYTDFGSWVNDNWTAYDILSEPTHYIFDELWDEWKANIAHDIHYNLFDYFTNEDKE